jgi:amidophosphoribosyltransferase
VDVPPGGRYKRAVHFEDDHFHDECGVFGVFGAEEAANLTYLGLHSLQHRGQEAAGIVTSNGKQLFVHRGMGLVQDVFTPDAMSRLPGNRAIGHVRYSTAGGSHLKNAQPIAVDTAHGSIAVGHNGNLTNGLVLRGQLEEDGSIFSTDSDTEVFMHLIARSKATETADRVAEALRQVEGAYSLVFLSPEEMVAVRDPHGFRPLCLGQLGEAAVVASEPPAFALIGAEYVRDLDPGEMIVVNQFGTRSLRPFGDRQTPRKMCIFEYVYFARPDSRLEGVSVYEARKRMGRILAEDCPADVDVVIPVPDSGVAAALGFAEASKTPFELGLIRSHYVGRTFIEPQQSIRGFGVRLKLHPVGEILKGKRVAIIDDSIVRGTTSRKIVRMVRDAGAKEIHLRISSPPTAWPCFYGIDTPTRSELIASKHSPEDVAKFVTADSLGYLSLEGLHRAVGGEGYCDACFSGNYPVPIADEHRGRRQLPLVGV